MIVENGQTMNRHSWWIRSDIVETLENEQSMALHGKASRSENWATSRYNTISEDSYISSHLKVNIVEIVRADNLHSRERTGMWRKIDINRE